MIEARLIKMTDYSYLILGGDKRQVYLYNILKSKNKKVKKIFLSDNDDENGLTENFKENVIILPIPSSTDGKNLYTPLINKTVPLKSVTEKISNDAILFTGGENPLFIQSKAKRRVNLLSSETLTLKNALATTEATLSIIINNISRTIFGSNILVIGYGRIGEMLTDYLIALKGKVSVCARKDIARTKAELKGAETFGFNMLNHFLPKFDLIINTVPAQILGKAELQHINRNALVIDLASKPAGIDFKYAKDLKLNTIHALSLPGKYSPLSAAEYIEEAIEQALL